MKIGILTYHRTHNYGGCLQALATRLILESMGHEVYYIDYWPEYHRHFYSIFKKDVFLKLGLTSKIKYVVKFLLSYKIKNARKQSFEKYLNKYVMPYCKPTDEKFDIILYGSDQIWRKQSLSEHNDYNPVYFGQNVFCASKHICFSVSMGDVPQSFDDKNKICHWLKRFDKISVRERNLLQFVINLGYTDAIQTLDPTLLLNLKEWDSFFSLKDYKGPKYLLLYTLRGDFDKSALEKFAEDNNLIIKQIFGSAEKRSTDVEITDADPIAFLNLIRNAEYVFTSSFHGMVFSLIYKKEFFVTFNSNKERAKSLLDTLGIAERYIDDTSEIPMCTHINYDQVLSRLDEMKSQTISYLKKL